MEHQCYHVGWCPYCDRGWIDIQKNALDNRLFLLCDECDTIWRDPEYLILGEPTVPRIQIKINEAPSLKEIEDVGWDKFLISIDDL